MRFLYRLLSFSFIALFMICSVRLDALAIDSSTRSLTVQETLDLFGESLTVKYFNGSDYVETTADYVLSGTIFPASKNSISYYSDLYDRVWLKYNMNLSGGNPNANPDYITVDLSPIATIIDSSVFQCCIASNNQFDNGVSNIFSLSRWSYKLDGVEKIQYSTDTASSSYHDYIRCYISSQNYLRYCTPVYINESVSSDFSLVTGRVCFYGTTGGAIFISCPVVSAEAVVESGDTSGDHGGSDSGGTDLTETNGLIGTLTGWVQSLTGFVQGIPQAIGGLFVPDDDFIDDFRGTVSAMFSEHFGALIEAQQIIDDIYGEFDSVTAQDSINFPAVEFESLGGFTFGGWNVSLKPQSSSLSVLYSTLAVIIDVICTLALINALKLRLERLVSGGEES